MTEDGTYVYSAITGSAGKCRIDPIADNEGDSTHRIFLDIVSLDHVDTIYVDGVPYEIRAIQEYQNKTAGHHYELEVFAV